MIIAVHDSANSWSKRWLAALASLGIEPRLVDALSPSIVSDLRGADAFLWHWDHGDAAAWRVARGIFAACDAAGIATIPDAGAAQHFDDKVAQALLLQSIEAPIVPTWVFVRESDALAWVEATQFPKVWKLRRGAGALNVRLVETASEASALVAQAFGHGFSPVPAPTADLKNSVRRTRSLPGKIRRLPRTMRNYQANRAVAERESGYAYFQEFIPGNDFDIRVTVVGDRAFTFRRACRPGDFRASGSGRIDYLTDPSGPDRAAVDVAFATARRLRTRSMAFDFVVDQAGAPLIVEMSYGYKADAVYACPGHFDAEGRWVEGSLWPQDAMLADLLADLGPPPVSLGEI